MTAWHGLPIGRHVDCLAGWRYLFDAAYRNAVRKRWRSASRYEVVMDRVLGVLGLLISTLLFVVLAAALVNALR